MINSGVHVKGLTEGATEDFYRVVQHIYELEYNTITYPKRVVLFYCNWFDPSSKGTRVDPKYGTMEIQIDKRYNLFDPFISTHNVRQVYYVSYPATRREKCGWCDMDECKAVSATLALVNQNSKVDALHSPFVIGN